MHIGAESLGVGTMSDSHRPLSVRAAAVQASLRTDTITRVEVTADAFAGWAASGSLPAVWSDEKDGMTTTSNFGHFGRRPPAALSKDRGERAIPLGISQAVAPSIYGSGRGWSAPSSSGIITHTSSEQEAIEVQWQGRQIGDPQKTSTTRQSRPLPSVKNSIISTRRRREKNNLGGRHPGLTFTHDSRTPGLSKICSHLNPSLTQQQPSNRRQRERRQLEHRPSSSCTNPSSSSNRMPAHPRTELHPASLRTNAMKDGRRGNGNSGPASPRGRAVDRSAEVHHGRRTEHAASRDPAHSSHHHHHHDHRRARHHEHQDRLGGKARVDFFGGAGAAVVSGGGDGSRTRPQQERQQRPQHWNRQKQTTKADKEPPTNKPARIWKSAVDAKSGRTYYYDAVTRETQWRKPLELATDEERRTLQKKERKQRDFFAAMEANILKSMARGSLVPGTPKLAGSEEEREGVAEMKSSLTSGGSSAEQEQAGVGVGASKATKKATLLPKGLKPTQRAVRTISTMDDALLAELAKTKANASSPPGESSSSKASPDAASAFPFAPPLSSTSIPIKEQATPLASHLHSSFPPPGGQSSSSSSSSSLAGRGGGNGERDVEDQAIAQVRRTADEIAALTSDGSTPNSAPAGTTGRNGVADTDASSSSAVSTPDPSVLRKMPKPLLQQRNTCGTLYVSSTMSDPDKDATIKCVCGVYRAHMLQAAREEAGTGFGPTVKFDEYEIFNDLPSQRGRGLGGAISISPPVETRKNRSFDDSRDDPPPVQSAGKSAPPSPTDSQEGVVVSNPSSSTAENVSIEALSLESIEGAVPSLDDITKFYRDVFRRSQMEADCIIMSLIYIERLIKVTNGGVRPRIGNWRSVLFASMIMSSKVWDDLSMWNADFSQTCPSGVKFPLQRINELELAMLNCLKFNVKVQASEYAKYYFLLRSMCIRSGLAGQDLMDMNPLDVEGARKLEHLSAAFQGTVGAGGKAKLAKPKLGDRRSKSTGEVERTSGSPTALDGARSTSPTGTAKVNLEQVVQM